MSRKTVHVTPHPDGGWQVIKGGGERASALAPTQKEVIDIGKGIAVREGAELVIHRPDGTIRDSDSYGKDPCPPKDTKH